MTEGPRRLGSNLCIVCGQENPSGLHLSFLVDRSGSAATWLARAPFDGFPGVIHGGIVMALLDDAMWYAAFGQGGMTLTAQAQVRYRRPLEVGMTVDVQGVVRAHRGRIWGCAAELTADGQVLATAEGTFLPVPADRWEALVGSGLVHEVPADQ